MILKEKDSLEYRIRDIEAQLQKANSSERKRLEGDLAKLRAGDKGERDAAYLIDFDLKSKHNWVVIHDLRLEWNDRVAQIDHLIINRLLEVYVVETKNIRTKIRYQNGGWERINFKHWEGMPSPVEQNRRHISVLKELISTEKLAPSRLGISMACDYYNIVAVSPHCSISGQFPKDVWIVKMDELIRRIEDADPTMTSMFKVISRESLEEFGRKIVAYHRPSPMLAPKPVSTQAAKTHEVCGGCGGAVTPTEAFFCRLAKNKARFAGKILCRGCQTFVPAEVPQKPIAKVCDNCGTVVEPRVIAFCIANEVRFKTKILCRSCQGLA